MRAARHAADRSAHRRRGTRRSHRFFTTLRHRPALRSAARPSRAGSPTNPASAICRSPTSAKAPLRQPRSAQPRANPEAIRRVVSASSAAPTSPAPPCRSCAHRRCSSSAATTRPSTSSTRPPTRSNVDADPARRDPRAGHHFEEPGALDEVAQLAAEWCVDQFARALPGAALAPRPVGPPVPRSPPGRRAARRLASTSPPPAHRVRLAARRRPRRRRDCARAARPARRVARPQDRHADPARDWDGRARRGRRARARRPDRPLVRRHARRAARDVHKRAAEIRRRARLYRGDASPPDVRGKTVVLVDDGIATGGTLRAAIRGARKRGAPWVVVAAPVASAEAAAALARRPTRSSACQRRST